jgi:hypothetical protein
MTNHYCAVTVCALVLVLTIHPTLFSIIGATATGPDGFKPVFQKGMSYRHYPYPYDSSFSNESLKRMAGTNTEYVAITVWWLQENVAATQIYRKANWTATDKALATAVAKAHELGMKVMLKPMVDPEDAYTQFRGDFPGSAEWFESYGAFIGSYAAFAQKNNVDLFCIGCEFRATEKDETDWRRVIDEVKEHYMGPLTYAATFDSFQSITWWDRLDYVGIDAYFPLTSKNHPSIDELKQSWNRIANAIENWASTVKKPIIFTEIGYRSGDGNNIEPANWIAPLNPDPEEQLNSYSAAFQTLWNRPWFYGFYWWIWETNPNAGGLTDADFTPQNKPVELLLKNWYSTQSHADQTTDLPRLIVYSGVSAAVFTCAVLVLTREFTNRRNNTLKADASDTKN